MSIEPEKLYEKILPSIKADFGHIGVEADLEDATWNIVNILEDVLTPRTITTVGELDALPVGSKVVSAGYEWAKNYQTNHTPGYEAEREVWFNVYDDFETSEELSLPATVLYEPTV